MTLKFKDIQKEVYFIYLTPEEDEQVMELIEKAYRLGWEEGYDEAKSKLTEIYTLIIKQI